MNWNNFLRPEIKNLDAYESARSLTAGVGSGLTYLDANESPDAEDLLWNRYPEPQPKELLNRLSRLYGVRTENLLMGRGSDEAIDLLTRAVCAPVRDSVLIFPPTYGMYKVAAEIQGARIRELPLRELLEMSDSKNDALNEILKQEGERLKLIYICNPNNPTGELVSVQTIIRVCNRAPEVLVVVDEAYIEYCAERSCVGLLPDLENLVILRTFSKAWGLAGVRFGVLIADPALLRVLQKVRAPYPLPGPVIEFMRAAISTSSEDRMLSRVEQILLEKKEASAELARLECVDRVFESAANFILVRFKRAFEVQASLAREGILVRSRGKDPGLENCLRITLGSTAENHRVLNLLRNF